MLGNLGITHSHHVHGFKLDFGLRWGKAIEFAVVIAVIGHSQAAKGWRYLATYDGVKVSRLASI